MQRISQQHRNGFTLIEVMIVVVIIAILGAIALPSYQEHVMRGRRAEARSKMLEAAQWLERVATARGIYIVNATDLPSTYTEVKSGANRTYSIAYSSGNAGATYTLTATPEGAQAHDKCGNLTLTQSGQRGRSGSGASVEECWNR